MPTITLPDGSKREFAGAIDGARIAASIGPRLAQAAVAVRVDGVLKDLAAPITTDASVAVATTRRTSWPRPSRSSSPRPK